MLRIKPVIMHVYEQPKLLDKNTDWFELSVKTKKNCNIPRVGSKESFHFKFSYSQHVVQSQVNLSFNNSD